MIVDQNHFLLGILKFSGISTSMNSHIQQQPHEYNAAFISREFPRELAFIQEVGEAWDSIFHVICISMGIKMDTKKQSQRDRVKLEKFKS